MFIPLKLHPTSRKRLWPLVFLLSFLFFPSFPAQAADEILSPVQLNPIYITTAKRTSTEVSQVAQDVSVYTKEDINALPAQNLSEVLNYIPGVNVKVTNGFGQPTSLSIRGSQSRQVLLMVDGIPFNTQLSGQANPSRLPLADIQQIEVIKGAASSVWGSGLGGVINVVTKDPADSATPTGRITSSFAEFGTFINTQEVSGKVKKLGYYLTQTLFETNGIRPGNGSRKKNAFGKWVLDIGDQSKLMGSFGYTREDLGDMYTISGYGRVVDSRLNTSRYGKLEWTTTQERGDFKAAVKYNNLTLKTDLDYIDLPFLSPVNSSNVYYGVSLIGTRTFREEDKLVYGTDFDLTVFKTSASSLPEPKEARSQAGYLNYTFVAGPWELNPGVRYDHDEHFGSQVSPSFGTIYKFDNARNTRLSFMYGRDFNAPPLLWIFQSSSSTLPNPDLKPEKADLWQLGVNSDIFSDKLNLDCTFFWSEVKDAIESMKIGAKTKKVNINKEHRRGVEARLTAHVDKYVDVYATGAFTDARNAETNAIIQDSDIARISYSVGLKVHNNSGFHMDLIGTYNRSTASATYQPNDRKFLLDARFRQEITNALWGKNVEVFLNIHNVTNSKYWSSITFPLPRRYFEGGLSFIF